MINLSHALLEKQSELARRHGKVILLHDNATVHIETLVEDTIKTLGWDQLSH